MTFAAYLQQVAMDLSLPVSCDARTVARWEDGDVRWPQEPYRRLLTVATGLELADLGFALEPRRNSRHRPSKHLLRQVLTMIGCMCIVAPC